MKDVRRHMKSLKWDYSIGGCVSRCLEDICEREGYSSVRDLCAKHDISDVTVMNMIYTPSSVMKTIIKICTEFGISADRLLGLPEDIR